MPDYNNLCMGCMGDKKGNSVCPSCGFNENEVQSISFMPIRTLLDGRYLIGTAIDSNCEGVTYLSWDTEENIPVRVREYFPEAYATRADDGVTVSILSGKEFEFNRHIGQFIEIARCLARCSDLPSLFPITDIFESNSTAYYVTEHVKTITMREFLIRNGGSLSWEQIRPLLMPVISTLSALHNEGLIHAGISPETLIVGVDGRVRITGFCVPDARTLRKDSSAMNAQLFPGFAAIEQYEADAEQGAWTDVYGLCATLYKILVGSPPADATERVTNDKMIIPAKIAQEIPRNVLSTLADGLAILSDDRTQSMDDLKNSLIPTATAVEPHKATQAPQRKKVGLAVAIAAGVVLVAIVFCIYFFLIRPSIVNNDPDVESNAPAPVSSTASLLDDPASAATTFAVPNLVNVLYSDAIEREDVAPYFKLEIVEAEYNGNYPNGTILEQKTAEGTMLKPGSTVQVKISLGSSIVSIPATKGKTVDEVTLELLKLGFSYNNIVLKDMYDAKLDPGVVVSTTPDQGASVSIYSKIYVYVNSYSGNGNTVGTVSNGTSGTTSSGSSSTAAVSSNSSNSSSTAATSSSAESTASAK